MSNGVVSLTYVPADFLEQTATLQINGASECTLERGSVRIVFPNTSHAAVAPRLQDLWTMINARLRARQLLTHQHYELGRADVVIEHEDGRRDIFVTLSEAVVAVCGMQADVIVKDSQGRIVRDSRAARLSHERDLGAALIDPSAMADAVLQRVLCSYENAVKDPEDELVHLYEIREALSAALGGDALARQALDISDADWRTLGRLANSEPIRPGRHRGSHSGALRDATEGELREARRIARSLIEGYLNWRRGV